MENAVHWPHGQRLVLLIAVLASVVLGSAGLYELHRRNILAEARLAAEAQARNEEIERSEVRRVAKAVARARRLTALAAEVRSARMRVSALETELEMRMRHLAFLRSFDGQGQVLAAQEEAALAALREKHSEAKDRLAMLEQRYWNLSNEPPQATAMEQSGKDGQASPWTPDESD